MPNRDRSTTGGVWSGLFWAGSCVILVVSLGGFAGCGSPSPAQAGGAVPTAAATPTSASEEAKPEEEQDTIAVRVLPVSSEPISALYTTSATLRADKRATVTARTNGVVRQLRVEEGDWVTEGQVLAVLEDDEQKIEHRRASTTRDTKLREFDRATNLYEQGLMSEEEFETIRREAEELRQAAELTKLRLERTVVRASFAGRITVRHLDTGNTVSDGTPFYDIADLDPLYADVNVPERQIARLSKGQEVRLLADASANHSLATIERIAPVVDPTTGTVKVTLAVKGASDLRPGSFVRVEIVTDTHSRALVVSRSALVAEGRRWFLFRLAEGGNQVEQLQVSRGFEEGDRVEILETIEGTAPLRDGDEVVVVGASALTDEAFVNVVDDDAEEATETAGEETAGEGGGVAA